MSKNRRFKIILILVEVSRIGLPFLIFTHPLLALICSLLLDNVDGQLFYEAGAKWSYYNTIDKLLDYWWYVFIVLYLWNAPIFGMALVLFLYRSIGQFIGIFRKDEKIYRWFPNILEWFFLLYLLFPHLNVGISLVISLLWSIFVEWLIHKSNAHIV
ncbi:hypothetical protein HY086_02725 [Candidatus Gottesmanbacteria bacterium]|nr:hypothetical protein [Candidatus Gottesmanbacteria bacterium]